MIITAGSTFNAGGLTLAPSSNFKLNNINLVQSNDVVNFIGHSIVKRTYKFSASTESFLGELRINYETGELNGNKEENLKIFLHDGTKWQALASKINSLDSHHVQTQFLNHGLNELTLAALNMDSDLTVFGNPVTRSKLVFRIANADAISFYNSNGDIIYNKKLEAGFHYIDVYGLSPGLYYLKSNKTIKKIFILTTL